ncbi:MAG: hypothetical protein AB1403_18400 [Candidatus Riflebacteria bacterium]
MKRTISIIFMVLVANFSLAAETSTVQISQSSEQQLLLKKSVVADSIEHNDCLIIKTAGLREKQIFASEGRDIEKVFEPDLDGDGIKEILIQMDLGGSGGFKEFALLKKEEDTYKVILEETGYAGAETSISHDEKSKQERVLIKFLDDNFDPPKPAVAVFGWQNDGIKRLR